MHMLNLILDNVPLQESIASLIYRSEILIHRKASLNLPTANERAAPPPAQLVKWFSVKFDFIMKSPFMSYKSTCQSL